MAQVLPHATYLRGPGHGLKRRKNEGGGNRIKRNRKTNSTTAYGARIGGKDPEDRGAITHPAGAGTVNLAGVADSKIVALSVCCVPALVIN